MSLQSEEGNGTIIPIIKRFSFLNSNNVVDFDALNYHSESVRAKIIRGFENYERNTGMVHPAAVQRNKTGKRAGPSEAGLELTSHFEGNHWYAMITIGTPAKSFTVKVDTGSSELFVPGPHCRTCRGHTSWNPTVDSSSAKPENRRFYVKYADTAYSSGYLFIDNVTIAGITADTQVVGAARIYSSQFQKSKFPPDGMMGMAFHTLSTTGANTIFETLVGENKLTEKVFSFMLTPTGGELFVGGSNDKLYDGEFTYTRVTQQAYWQVNMEGVVGRGKTILSDVDAIIDTGSTFISGDLTRVEKFHKELGGMLVNDGVAGEWYTYLCDDFPSISLTFGGKSFEIDPDALNVGRISEKSPYCVCGIYGMDTESTFWLVGGTFLQSVYTRFDLGNLRVGFANLPGQQGLLGTSEGRA